MTEVAVALALLLVVSTLVAELTTWMITERSRTAARVDAVEIAANELEEARAVAWDKLTPEWAANQKLSAHVLDRWPDMKLTVRVEPEPNRPRVKRVTVELTWTEKGHAHWPVTTLTAVFADRTTGGGS
jgi:hypothetical protein